MKIYNDSIGKRTRDLPACSTVPQPTAPPRLKGSGTHIYHIFKTFNPHSVPIVHHRILIPNSDLDRYSALLHGVGKVHNTSRSARSSFSIWLVFFPISQHTQQLELQYVIKNLKLTHLIWKIRLCMRTASTATHPAAILVHHLNNCGYRTYW